jgi:hypothetical protein
VSLRGARSSRVSLSRTSTFPGTSRFPVTFSEFEMTASRLAFLGRTAALILLAACSGAGDGGEQTTGPSVPEFMQKTAGDEQSGAAGVALPQALEVKVTDKAGRGISGFTVSFAASAGSVNPQSMSTDANGLARTVLTLPNATANVTVTASGAGLTAQTFVAHSLAAQLTINETFLPAARRGLAYSRRVTGAGGGGAGGFTFGLASGSLPPGINLAADGTFSGTPTQSGSFPFSLRIRDASGTESNKSLTLQVCDPASAMSVGEVRVSDPVARGGCGVFLPAGATGDRYRVAIVNTSANENEAIQAAGLYISGLGVTAATTAPAPAPLPYVQRHALPGNVGALMSRIESSRAAHLRDLEENVALIQRIGVSGMLENRPRPALAASLALPDRVRLDPSANGNCSASGQVTAILLAEDSKIAVYQDSTQNATTATRVTQAMAQKLIDNFKYADPIVRNYFGGVPDTDGNGKVIVFITPAVGSQVLGRVFSGDFLTKSQCASSNQGEYIYFNADAVTNILQAGALFSGTYILAHEIKHVASLYQRTDRFRRAGDGSFQPTWEEEGFAELSAERAARYAWSQMGGPAMAAMVTSAHLRSGDGTAITLENEAVLWMLYSAQDHLSRQPNSVVQRVPGAPLDYLYSSGWVFGRWLGDAYGNASAGEMADSAVFRRLNDWSTVSGVSGMQTVTGKTWGELMIEFAAAAMANGRLTSLPRGFTSYDYVSAIEMWCFALDPKNFPNTGCRDSNGQNLPAGPAGAFPWPVTTDATGVSESRSFLDATFTGQIGPAGLRVHDFISNGSGQGAEIDVEVPTGKVVVLRLR